MDVDGLVGWFDGFAGKAMGKNYSGEIKNRKLQNAWAEGSGFGRNRSTALVMMYGGG